MSGLCAGGLGASTAVFKQLLDPDCYIRVLNTKTTVCVNIRIKHKEWLYWVAVNGFRDDFKWCFLCLVGLCLMVVWRLEIALVWLRSCLQLIPSRTSRKQAATWPPLPPSIKTRYWTGSKTRTLGELDLSTSDFSYQQCLIILIHLFFLIRKLLDIEICTVSLPMICVCVCMCRPNLETCHVNLHHFYMSCKVTLHNKLPFVNIS